MTQLPPDELAALPGTGMLSPGTLVLELGNKKNSTGLYRDWYTDQGLNYVCLDWNGLDGAVPLDMRYSLQPDDVQNGMERGFDLVTNFGFTEHVEDQMTCWHNVHNFVGVGGWLSICMPLMPHWKGHGLWMPTVEWYASFAELNGYSIIYSTVWDRVRPTFVACMRKMGKCDVFEMPVGMIERSSA